MRERITEKALIICCIVVFFHACSKDGQRTPSAATATGQTVGAGPARPEESLKVQLLPDKPTTQTSLQARVMGAGSRVFFQWQRNGQVIAGQEGAQLPKGSFLKGDSVTVIVKSGDSEAAATVVIVNIPPEIVSITINPAPENIFAGVDLTAVPVGSDADGDVVRFRYQWLRNNEVIAEDGPVLNGGSFRKGDWIQCRVVPYNDTNEGIPYLSNTITVRDAPPRIVSTPPREFSGEVYSYQVTAEDPDRDPVTFSLTSGPPGMVINASTGLLQWKVDRELAGEHVVEIVAQDPEGSKYIQKYTLTVPKQKVGGEYERQ